MACWRRRRKLYRFWTYIVQNKRVQDTNMFPQISRYHITRMEKARIVIKLLCMYILFKKVFPSMMKHAWKIRCEVATLWYLWWCSECDHSKLKCGGLRLLSHYIQVMCNWQALVSDPNQRAMAYDRLLCLCMVFCWAREHWDFIGKSYDFMGCGVSNHITSSLGWML